MTIFEQSFDSPKFKALSRRRRHWVYPVEQASTIYRDTSKDVGAWCRHVCDRLSVVSVLGTDSKLGQRVAKSEPTQAR